MTERFKRYIFDGEEILWLGESTPESPQPNVIQTKYRRQFAVCFILVGLVFFVMSYVNGYMGSTLISGLAFGAAFMLGGILFYRSTVVYRQEYYCLTNERLLVICGDSITKYELFHAKRAEVTVLNGEYGSVGVYLADHTIYSGRTNQYSPRMAGIRGVRDFDECCRLVNEAISKIDKNINNHIEHVMNRPLAEADKDEYEALKQRLGTRK